MAERWVIFGWDDGLLSDAIRLCLVRAFHSRRITQLEGYRTQNLLGLELVWRPALLLHQDRVLSAASSYAHPAPLRLPLSLHLPRWHIVGWITCRMPSLWWTRCSAWTPRFRLFSCCFLPGRDYRAFRGFYLGTESPRVQVARNMSIVPSRCYPSGK